MLKKEQSNDQNLDIKKEFLFVTMKFSRLLYQITILIMAFVKFEAFIVVFINLL